MMVEGDFLDIAKCRNCKKLIKNEDSTFSCKERSESVTLGSNCSLFVLDEKMKKEHTEKEKQKEQEMKLLLMHPKKQFQRLGMGLHKGIYYFGTVVEKEGKTYNAIVTSEPNMYVSWNKYKDEIKEQFGLNYRFDLFGDCIDYSWNNHSISRWLYEYVEPITIKELFEEIYSLNKEYVYHIEDGTHIHVACDIIKNYYYSLFETNGRTYFQADFESGKSRQCSIYHLLSFNPINAGNIKPAMLDRISESTGGTMIVDNFDNMNEEQQKEILQFIEVYYRKGSKNIKGDIRTHKPQAFNGYSPLVINNIIGLPKVTESRCNKELMVRTKDKKITDKKLNEDDPKWGILRDRLHISALQNYKKVQEVYNNLRVKELSARDLERVEGVLAIAKCVSEEVYQKLFNHFIKLNKQQNIKELSDDWEFTIFKYLHKTIEGISKVKVNDITEELAPTLFDSASRDYQSNKLKFSHYIGKIFRNNPLIKRYLSGGYVFYEIKRENLDKLLEIKGFKEYLTPKVTEEEVDGNTTNTTNSTYNTDTTHTTEGSSVSKVSNVDMSNQSGKEEVFTKLPAKDQEVSKCGYCGQISYLAYKDDKGNFACSYCAGHK